MLSLIIIWVYPAWSLLSAFWVNQGVGHVQATLASPAEDHGALHAGLGTAAAAARRLACYENGETKQRICDGQDSGPLDFGVSEELISLIGLIASIVVLLGLAVLYKMMVTDRRDPFPPAVPAEWSLAHGNFRYGLCGFCEETPYCLYGCCCPELRIADSFATIAEKDKRFNSYWLVFLLFFLLNVIFPLVAPILPFGQDLPPTEQKAQIVSISSWLHVCLAIFLSYKRQELRRKFGATGATAWCSCTDCLSFLFCMCCTAIQDGRQVDGATNTRVECCFKLIKKYPEAAPVGLVGAPVWASPAPGAPGWAPGAPGAQPMWALPAPAGR